MRIPVAIFLCCSLSGFASAEDKPLPKKSVKGVTPPRDDGWANQLVIPKKPMNEIRFGDWVEGKQVYVTPVDLLLCTVIEDREGFLRVHDSGAEGAGIEGWVLKQDFLLKKDAPAYWAEVRKSKPTDPFSIFMHGFVDRNRGDDSIADMDEAIRLEPKNMMFVFNRGYYLLMIRHDARKGFADFNDAVRLAPNVASNHRYRGCAYLALNEQKKAIDDLNQAIRLRPNYAGAYSDRAALWSMEEEFEKAIADAEKAIRIDPTFSSAFTIRTGAWISYKAFDKALADANEVMRLDSNDAESVAIRGHVYQEMKKYDEALADFDAALKLNPRNETALTCKGITLGRIGRFSEACVAFGEATAFGFNCIPFEYAAWFYATCPKDIFRDGKKALEYLVKAKELGARGISYWKTLAAAYAETGQFELAVVEQTKVVEKLKSDKKPDADDVKKAEVILEAYKSKKPYRDVNE
jgi:tetratricopeptide (TPR) repeat protein